MRFRIASGAPADTTVPSTPSMAITSKPSSVQGPAALPMHCTEDDHPAKRPRLGFVLGDDPASTAGSTASPTSTLCDASSRFDFEADVVLPEPPALLQASSLDAFDMDALWPGCAPQSFAAPPTAPPRAQPFLFTDDFMA